MIEVLTDFNAMTADGTCWILVRDDKDLEEQLIELGLEKGSKIKLFQDDDDFDVVATLDFRTVATHTHPCLVAIPDWTTKTVRQFRR